MDRGDQDFLRDFYRALIELPLNPLDPRYVRLYDNELLAPADPVAELQTVIEWAPLESAQLFSGFRGTGKSTELRRLKAQLEETGTCKVVLCDMQDYLNLTTPIDISDFLLAVAGAFGDRLAEEAELMGSQVLKEGYWERFYNFLTRSHVALTDLGLQGEVAGIGAQVRMNLKADPSFRKRLQEQMRGHLGSLVRDVRGFVEECVQAVWDKHGDQTRVVLLLDSVEQIRGTLDNALNVAASVDTLFQGHADKLKLPYLHVVYTVPPWLKIKVPGVAGLYDGAQQVPCVKVKKRDGALCAEGMDALRKVVQLRGDWRRLLGDDEAMDRLLVASGGYLRDLFRLLQTALRSARRHGMPLTSAHLDLVCHELRNSYLPITNEDALWLERIEMTHTTQLEDSAQLPDLSRYFDTHLVLTYRNGDEWWAVHPLLVEHVHRQAAEIHNRRAALAAALTPAQIETAPSSSE